MLRALGAASAVAEAPHDGRIVIRAEVMQGTRRDAVLHACGANATHGLKRTPADKRRAVETLLRDEEWSRWGDREIARRCAVSDKTVASVRVSLVASAELPQMPTERTVERNGKVYQQNTANIGRKPAPREEPAAPEAPAPKPAARAEAAPQPAPVVATPGDARGSRTLACGARLLSASAPRHPMTRARTRKDRCGHLSRCARA